MTVKRLIEELQKEEPNLEVTIRVEGINENHTTYANIIDEPVTNGDVDTGYNHAVDQYSDGTIAIVGYEVVRMEE